MAIDLHTRFMGTMIGSALGDAIGERALEITDRDDLLEFINGDNELSYTDDTVMSLATAELLVNQGEIDQQLLGDKFRKYHKEEPWRNYGVVTSGVFTIVENEAIDYTAAALRLCDGSGSFGNGAAMRVAPLGLYFHRSPELYSMAKKTAEITHAHPVGIDGAAVLAKAVAMSLHLNSRRPFAPQVYGARLVDFAETTRLKEKLKLVLKLVAAHATVEEAAQELGTQSAVNESMAFALFCFLTHPHAFVECVLCAVSQGGDRGTMGAMVGAMAGAYLGSEAIPPHWQRRLENTQHIETLARELAARSTL